MNATSVIEVVIFWFFFYIVAKMYWACSKSKQRATTKSLEESLDFQSETQELSFKRKQNILFTPVCLFSHAILIPQYSLLLF